MDIKPTLVAAWFGAALISLYFSIFLFVFFSTDKVFKPQNQNFKLYSALPLNNNEVLESIDLFDGRPVIVKDFFQGYGSFLAGYSNLFITVADKYQLDWRLLPAISMQESNGGKKVITNSFNPFGFGIYGNLVIKFSSWEDAIEKVAKALKEDYLNQGLTTPEKIMAKYTPPSLASGGSWAIGVKSFMEELR